jgi:protein subunit release factor A
MQSVPPAVADGSKGIKVVKKPRAADVIEAEIAELEKRLSELSDEMAKPEVARDITKLVAVNDEYEQTQKRLADLYDEWERAERAVATSKRK